MGEIHKFLKSKEKFSNFLPKNTLGEVAKRLNFKSKTSLSVMFGENVETWNDEYFETAISVVMENHARFRIWVKEYRQAVKKYDLAGQIKKVQKGTAVIVPVQIEIFERAAD